MGIQKGLEALCGATGAENKQACSYYVSALTMLVTFYSWALQGASPQSWPVADLGTQEPGGLLQQMPPGHRSAPVAPLKIKFLLFCSQDFFFRLEGRVMRPHGSEGHRAVSCMRGD